MQTKLTLGLDDALIERAKAWARARGVSLSETVASFFAQLPGNVTRTPLSSWTTSHSGSEAAGEPPPTNEAIRVDYRAHLERKHS